MEPRRLRVGDVLDDYCPRERRLSNHVIVALVDEVVKQTRCTTCDFEHPYKHARVPARRKKDSTATLIKQVLEDAPTEQVPRGPGHAAASPARGVLRPNGGAPASPALGPADDPDEVTVPVRDEPAPRVVRTRGATTGRGRLAPVTNPVAPPSDVPVAAAARLAARDESAATSSAPSPATTDGPPQAAAPAHSDARVDEGPVHRTLIRATLPRPEGSEPPARPIPTFTAREAATQPKFRRYPRPRFGHGQPPPGAFGDGGGNQRPPHMNAHPGRGGGHKAHQPQRAGQPGGRRQRRGNKRFK